MAGSSAALAVNPIDVIKTRLQAIKKAEGEVEYKGVVDCFVYVNIIYMNTFQILTSKHCFLGKHYVMKVLWLSSEVVRVE